jgi:Cu-Zn family superoxide dismutase
MRGSNPVEEVRSMRQVKFTIVAVALLALSGATMAFAGSGGPDREGDAYEDHGDRAGEAERGWQGRFASARLVDAGGRAVGHVWMRERRRDEVVQLEARVRGLPAGFHGFHIHAVGRCEAPGFTSAGGHFNPSSAPHGAHAGDLPSLLVTADGSAVLATATDRFSIADLRDADGSAVMVHSGPDNFANIPARYGGPDAETLATGDSGSRIACGVVR